MFNHFVILFAFFSLILETEISAISAQSDPDPAEIQTFLPAPSPPATIPAFPEQANTAGCHLDLSEELFHSVRAVCGDAGKSGPSSELYRSRCCPVLGTWLYSAYSATALQLQIAGRAPQTTSYDLPLLPDDSESCVDTLEKALRRREIELMKPNETCDVVYCYCGIRLHPLSCSEAFSVSARGELVGGKSVKRLERDCAGNSGDGFPGLGGCSKCLNSLYLLSEQKKSGSNRSSSSSEDRTSKMHSRDCQLMGLTWLLAKNRSAYIHTVSAVLRAIMMRSEDGGGGGGSGSSSNSHPKSCSLNSDGMPLAVDSSEINLPSFSTAVRSSSVYFYALLSLSLLFFFTVTATTVSLSSSPPSSSTGCY